MTNKILNYQILFLFFLSLLALVTPFYADSIPDNYLQITSTGIEAGRISYYFYSFISSVDYYIGPWIFFLFLLQLAIHTFVLSKRIFWQDTLVAPLLVLVLLPLGSIFYSEFVGNGLQYTLKNNTNTLALSFLFLASFVALIAVVARSSFLTMMNKLKELISFKSFLNGYDFIKNIQEKTVAFKDSLLARRKKKNVEASDANTSDDFEEEDQEYELEEDEIEDCEPAILLPAPENSLEALPVKSKTRVETTAKSNTTLNGKVDEKRYLQTVRSVSLRKGQSKTSHPDEQYFSGLVQRIEEKLQEFKIDGQIINILKGPVVDTFELELGPGMKVSRITSSAQDLSLALYGAPIRIVYPMKGRTTIGIEVPRNPREIIYLDDVLASQEFTNNHSHLPVAMGKDAFGQVFVVDLAAMPHMLVAGATGAGKSVFINTLLVSLLVKKSPAQMKLILIDPKQLELALYSRLPHLVMPVITEAKRATLALLWAVEEMERRYKILKELGVRNIEGFNDKLAKATPEMLANIRHLYPDQDGEDYSLPYIVIIVDEFADLILTKAGKEIENNICRLAAKARASGIHLVLATQRPSVDVITGLIKSNFPTRVSFRVTTDVDSRTILNAVGAERLLGKGDMLYKHGVETTRVHASYVDEKEIEELTDKLSLFECQFDSGAIEFLDSEGQSSSNDDPYAYGSHIPSVRDDENADGLYDEAVRVVIEGRMASASMLQRRLKIGYNRAANLIEEMESKGVVGPAQGSKPRKVLASNEDFR